jgi:hypothetical protein
MMPELTYKQAIAKADSLRDIGQTRIYLSHKETDFPWQYVTDVKEGGSHRLEMSTSVRFTAKCPDSGLEFNWSFDIEPPTADGKGYYQIDTAACQQVTQQLKGPALMKWRNYLSSSSAKVRAKGMEWRGHADTQLTTAAILADLAAQ